MSRKLKLFILASIVLNIILIGVIAKHSYHRYGISKDDKIIELLDKSSIADNKRQMIKKQLENSFFNEEKRIEKNKWREETRAILTAENLDIVEYRKQLEKMVIRNNENKKERVEAIIALVSQLNQQERILLAEIFKRSRK